MVPLWVNNPVEVVDFEGIPLVCSLLAALSVGMPVRFRLFLVGHEFLRWNCEAIDIQVGADAVDDQNCPAEINDESEYKVGTQIPKFPKRTNSWEANSREVSQDSTSNEWSNHNGPVWEWLSREVGQNNLGGHSPEYKRHCETE